jgi:hypothetical protein
VRNSIHPNRQKGITMISWMIIIGIAVFFVVLGMKLIPSYIEFYSVKQVLASVKQERNAAKQSPAQIRTTMLKRLKINGVYDFDPKNIKITKQKDGLQVAVEYEVRKNMAGNLDAVMTFRDKVTL